MNHGEKPPRTVVGVHIGGGGRRQTRAGLVWGGLITLVGLALLLDHLGVMEVERLYRFWPLLLVFSGVGYLFTHSGKVWGVFLILAGTILQLNKLGVTHVRFTDLWPLLIIALGVALMWGAIKSPIKMIAKGDSSDTVTAVAIFGGTERRITTRQFKGGTVNCAFGGVELDFRDADIDNDKATLEVNCVFGGVEIRVPENWHVHSVNIPVLGGYDDKTRVTVAGNPENLQKKTLVVSGLVVFGGVEIRN